MDENEDGEIDYEDVPDLRCFWDGFWPVKFCTWKEFTAWICSKHGTSATYQHNWWVSMVSHMSSIVPLVHAYCRHVHCFNHRHSGELPLAKAEPRKKKWWTIDEVPDKSVALYSEIIEHQYIECQWHVVCPDHQLWNDIVPRCLHMWFLNQSSLFRYILYLHVFAPKCNHVIHDKNTAGGEVEELNWNPQSQAPPMWMAGDLCDLSGWHIFLNRLWRPRVSKRHAVVELWALKVI